MKKTITRWARAGIRKTIPLLDRMIEDYLPQALIYFTERELEKDPRPESIAIMIKAIDEALSRPTLPRHQRRLIAIRERYLDLLWDDVFQVTEAAVRRAAN